MAIYVTSLATGKKVANLDQNLSQECLEFR